MVISFKPEGEPTEGLQGLGGVGGGGIRMEATSAVLDCMERKLPDEDIKPVGRRSGDDNSWELERIGVLHWSFAGCREVYPKMVSLAVSPSSSLGSMNSISSLMSSFSSFLETLTARSARNSSLSSEI